MLVAVTLSHRLAPVHLRERCAVAVEERPRVLDALRRRAGHAALLSTCGRVEIYLDAEDGGQAECTAIAWLAARAGCSPEELRPYVTILHGNAAVRQIVRVACGLESALEGEDEILGQVRRAWLEAGMAGALSPDLDATLRLAVRTGRKARRIGDPHGWTSLAETAAAHVALAIQGIPSPRVLIAGSGPMGLRAARALRARFGDDLDLSLAGRTPARVAAHAAALDARPLTLADIPSTLVHADAAIAGLRTPRTLIHAADIPARDPSRPLLVVDLSVPRAVEEAVAALPGVTLRDVDQLGAGEGSPGRWTAGEHVQVEGLVEEAVVEHVSGADRAGTAAALAALRMHADGIRRAQLERTLRRLPHLDEESRWVIDALTRAIVNRVLHEPTLRLKADTDGAVRRQVQDLFF
jgi:glutamyl-tRNA reductase